MVNTFLTYTDFRQSAQSLDDKRLGKQRVEAYQILNLLENIDFLNQRYRINITSPITDGIFKDICNYYTKIVKHENSINQIPLTRQDGIVIKLGFINHPAVKMWYGYKDSLREYINAHIEEWIRRGKKNTMIYYSNVENSPKPQWCYDTAIHVNHRSSLLKKEIERNEEPHYRLKDDFVNSGQFIDYIWPRAFI